MRVNQRPSSKNAICANCASRAQVHKQNLMVIRNVSIALRPDGGDGAASGRVAFRKIDAHCMNLSCMCSHGESMALTHWFFEGKQLGVQGQIWKWFEGKYSAGKGVATTRIPDDAPQFTVEEMEAELREEAKKKQHGGHEEGGEEE